MTMMLLSPPLLSPCAQSAMCCISCSHTLSLLLCVLTLTPTATGAGPETLCGAELVDTLQFVCGERGFYFSKCTFLFIHKGWLYLSQSSPPPSGLINKRAASLTLCLDFPLHQCSLSSSTHSSSHRYIFPLSSRPSLCFDARLSFLLGFKPQILNKKP